MAQLKEILEKEKERASLEQCAAVHLFREGTFYRAYEWSAWLKPYRIYASRSSVGRIRRKLRALAAGNPDSWEAPLNSYCGLLSHWNNYSHRSELLLTKETFGKYGMFDLPLRHYMEGSPRRLRYLMVPSLVVSSYPILHLDVLEILEVFYVFGH